MRKKRVVGGTLLLNAIGISHGVDPSLYPELFTLTNRVSLNDTEYQGYYKYQAINKYCNNALGATGVQGLYEGPALTYESDEFSFSSKDSLFIRALCFAWNLEISGRKELTEGIFKDKFEKTLNIQQFNGNQDACAAGNGNLQNQCDLARYSSKIYQALMSDLFKIKRAEVLQVPSVQDFKSKETRIARIFETYFAGSETQKNSYQKKYPKTTTMIDNNQKIIQKSLQTLTLLDNEKIREESKKECSPSSAIGNPLCGIHFSGDQTKGLNLHFVNLIMNEYFNYRLFIDYYTHRLQQVINNTSTDSIQTRMMYISEMNSLLQQRDLFEHSIKQSLKELQEVAMSYPLHVGLVRYQEVLLEFRDKYLAKLITPFYTLYEKLRNVQIPQS